MEWEKEASRMQNIYAGSDLTIAATDSPDGLSGCFPDTSSYGSMYAEVFATTNTASGQECIVQVHVGDLRTVASDSILNTRGWVLQEMVLSHRTLNCMHSALFWQCKTHLRTDSGLVLNCSAPSIRQSISGAPDATTTEMHRYWWTWMESYSERQFTIPDDRLPAMAGLVRHYQTASNDEPMLGLWKRSFTQDLLWMRRGTLGILEPDSRLRNMPSWSWLSCPTTINFDYWGASDAKSGKEQLQIVTDHASLADWNIQWVDEPLVSDLESSKVVIEGPVIELTFSTSPEGFGYRPPYLNINNEILDFERKKIPWRCAAQFDQFDAQDRRFPARYLCLLLRSRVYETETSFEVKEAFVILEPVDGSRDIYKRVGQGTITGDSPDTQTFDLQMRRRLELV
ncbi:hypothetical protein DL98DRAFT_517907 [Cadophora sp. DSE1049]|nr:hypothetical protein DL98DRAFT_517907 [Cadophora sp. DSE1049]